MKVTLSEAMMLYGEFERIKGDYDSTLMVLRKKIEEAIENLEIETKPYSNGDSDHA